MVHDSPPQDHLTRITLHHRFRNATASRNVFIEDNDHSILSFPSRFSKKSDDTRKETWGFENSSHQSIVTFPLAKSLLIRGEYFYKSSIVTLSADDLVTSQSTVVTAYYRVPSKHSPHRYIQWMENMLSLQDPMIIFTEDSFVDQIRHFRGHALNRTVIVPLELKDLPIGSLFSANFWQDQLKRDPEKMAHRSYQLFWIWLSKSWFVTQAIRLNMFNSNIYVWTDIGCFRKQQYNNKTMVQHPEVIPPTQVLQMATRKINPPPKPLFNDKIKQSSHFYHSGSQFAGYKSTLLTFHEYFLDTIDQFLANRMIVVDDQAVLQSTCLLHPTICAYVQRQHVDDNSYFGLRYILHHGGNVSKKYWTMKEK